MERVRFGGVCAYAGEAELLEGVERGSVERGRHAVRSIAVALVGGAHRRHVHGGGEIARGAVKACAVAAAAVAAGDAAEGVMQRDQPWGEESGIGAESRYVVRHNLSKWGWRWGNLQRWGPGVAVNLMARPRLRGGSRVRWARRTREPADRGLGERPEAATAARGRTPRVCSTPRGEMDTPRSTSITRRCAFGSAVWRSTCAEGGGRGVRVRVRVMAS